MRSLENELAHRDYAIDQLCEMVDALKQELWWAIDECNDQRCVNRSHEDGAPPDLIEMSVIHDADRLIEKIKGSIKWVDRGVL